MERARQGKRTIGYPATPPTLPARFHGQPLIDPSKCSADCHACEEVCPTDAIVFTPGERRLKLDLGRCLFCGKCQPACPKDVVKIGSDYRLAARTSSGLITEGKALEPVRPLDRNLRDLLGRSLKLRQVSAGGCNACEADTNVLGTVVFDLGRFGIQFVASPRHADGLLITGPVPENMKLALKKTYDAVPPPKIVIAVGACAISGGPYAGHSEVNNGAEGIVPVDLFIPGCPPHPMTILDGILRLLGQV
jgi:Ni,Fe-hydrogenase III small subunit/Pyruvate/2-oxoacid:ferredoxin oxidoreductase delta subunit